MARRARSFAIVLLVFGLLATWSAPAIQAQRAAEPQLGPSAVALQGILPLARGVKGPDAATDKRYVTAIKVEAFPSGGAPSVERPDASPIAVAHGQTDPRGRFQLVLDGMAPSQYDLVFRLAHALSFVVPAVTVPQEAPRVVELGILRSPAEGDADGDDAVTVLDYSLLVQAFGQHSALPAYDHRVDFNQDRKVSIADFSLLLANWAQIGEAATSLPPESLLTSPPPPPPVQPGSALSATSSSEGRLLDDRLIVWIVALAIPLFVFIRTAPALFRRPALAPATAEPAPSIPTMAPETTLAPVRAPMWQRILSQPSAVLVYSRDFLTLEPLVSCLEGLGSTVSVHLLDPGAPVPVGIADDNAVVVLDSDPSRADATAVFQAIRHGESIGSQQPGDHPPIVALCTSETVQERHAAEAGPGDHYVTRETVLAWAQHYIF